MIYANYMTLGLVSTYFLLMPLRHRFPFVYVIIFDAVLLVERLSELPTSFCQLTHLQVHPGQQRMVQNHFGQM